MPDYRGYAVFTRNHPQYLSPAAEMQAMNAEKKIAFRSAARWAEARKAVAALGSIPIYFGVIDGPPQVEYEARIAEVLLVEDAGKQDIERVLALSLEETSAEGLWDNDKAKVKTLYVIEACRKLLQPFPMTSLVKVSDGEPIHQDYTRAYSVVYDRMWQTADGVPEPFPGESLERDTYPEGACQRVYVNRYERNAKARARCIEEHGAVCMICGFDFERAYGEIGHGFIHVHHRTPLEQISEAYEVDPVADLVPVCPNCHAMIHRGTDAISIEALREQIAAQGCLPWATEAE